jgi:hypothetical protein
MEQAFQGVMDKFAAIVILEINFSLTYGGTIHRAATK